MEINSGKYIIGMAHFDPLPGDPRCISPFSLDIAADKLKRDISALQNGGVNAIMFSNEGSQPWVLQNSNCTVAAMAAILGKTLVELSVPFGVHVIWDAKSTLCLAAATGACFAWEVFTGVYASDYGVWNTDVAYYAASLREWGRINDLKCLCEIIPEAAVSLDERSLENRMPNVERIWSPYAFCIAGLQPGVAPPLEWLRKIPKRDAKLFISTGIRKENALSYLAESDGAIIGSAFKRNGHLFNSVDETRVRKMVNLIRAEFRT